MKKEKNENGSLMQDKNNREICTHNTYAICTKSAPNVAVGRFILINFIYSLYTRTHTAHKCDDDDDAITITTTTS